MTGACLEVAHTDRVLVRDSKPGNDGTVLTFGPEAWWAFLATLRN